MTSLEDRFWLTVVCAVHQPRWSVARLFSRVSLRICPCFLLLAHGWPEAYQASGTECSTDCSAGRTGGGARARRPPGRTQWSCFEGNTSLRINSAANGCLEVSFTQRVNLHLPRSEAVRGVRERPLLTALSPPVLARTWHGGVVMPLGWSP
jgi:hypothetical protein